MHSTAVMDFSGQKGKSRGCLLSDRESRTLLLWLGFRGACYVTPEIIQFTPEHNLGITPDDDYDDMKYILLHIYYAPIMLTLPCASSRRLHCLSHASRLGYIANTYLQYIGNQTF